MYLFTDRRLSKYSMYIQWNIMQTFKIIYLYISGFGKLLKTEKKTTNIPIKKWREKHMKTVANIILKG